MVSGVVRPVVYVWVAVLVSFLSLGVYYGMNVSSQNVGEAQVLQVAEVLDSNDEPVLHTGFKGFFSITNPLAWFMFGAWFALLLFFIISMMSGHARK